MSTVLASSLSRSVSFLQAVSAYQFFIQINLWEFKQNQSYNNQINWKRCLDLKIIKLIYNIAVRMNEAFTISSINAHGRSEISSIIQDTLNPCQFLTIAHDGLIKKWNLESVGSLKHTRIKCGYLTSLINFEQGFVVGTGNGQILKFDRELQRQWSKKVHFDCVTDLLQTEKHLISIGSDGKVYFMAKPTLNVQKQIDLSVPLTKITRIKDELYICGNPSFRINLANYQVTKQLRSIQFIEFKGRIFSCSEETGLSILGVKQHVEEIPCHFMLPFKDKLITVSEEIIGITDFKKSQEGEQELSYYFYRAPYLKKGYSIKGGFANDNRIFLAGEDGQVYSLKFQNERIFK